MAKQNQRVIDMISDKGTEVKPNLVDDRLRVLETKQVVSLELMHYILQKYLDDIKIGRGAERKPRQLYAAVLQYLNEDKPYPKLIDMLATSDLHMDKKVIRTLEESCNAYQRRDGREQRHQGCDQSAQAAIKQYVRSEGYQVWLGQFTDRIDSSRHLEE